MLINHPYPLHHRIIREHNKLNKLLHFPKSKAMGYKHISHFIIPILLVLHLFSPFVSPLDYPPYRFPYNRLDYNFYARSCPPLFMIVRYGVSAAFRNDTRVAASLLRVQFHDCFVNGCDASLLLDDTDDFVGEQTAGPNFKSIRGLDVIDNIKADVERACPFTVSCADIIILAAREAVALSGGPYWPVGLGRRDGTTANKNDVGNRLPAPFEPLENITAKFAYHGLDMKDVVVLSGAHTIGYAQCFTFKSRLFNYKSTGSPDPTLESSSLTNLQSMCPQQDGASNANLAPLDSSTTYGFDNGYYTNLVNSKGLLQSDQALMDDPTTLAMVNAYSSNNFLFSNDFAASMIKLSNIGVLTGYDGEIRQKCGSVNRFRY